MAQFGFVKWFFLLEILVGLEVGCTPILINATWVTMSITNSSTIGDSNFDLSELFESPASNSSGITLTIKFYYREEPHSSVLHLIEDPVLVDRNITGLWISSSNENAHQRVTFTPQPDVFEKIGDIAFFQNQEDYSALTRFTDASGEKTYTGILKKRYSVKNMKTRLPLKYKRSVTPSTDSLVNNDFSGAQERNATQKPKPIMELRPLGPFTLPPIKMPEFVYPKVLVALDFFTKMNYPSTEDCVKAFISQFNAVDMLYRQLDEPKIRLTIAGIIIPKDMVSTPFDNRDGNAGTLVKNIEAFFNREDERFPAENSDVFMYITSDKLYQGSSVADMIDVEGLSSSGSACGVFGSGRRSIPRGTSIVTASEGFRSVFLLTHELAHALGVYGHDGGPKAQTCPEHSGNIMCTSYDYLREPRWSSCSKQALQSFVLTRKAMCLFRRPTVIPDAVKSMEGAWISMLGQCENRFNDTSKICEVEGTSGVTYGCWRYNLCDTNITFVEGSLGTNGKRWINQTWINV